MMFVVQGVFETLHSPDVERHHDELYDRLLHDAEGIRINQYLRGIEDSASQLHFMAWDDQSLSEAFGVSAGFQQLRSLAKPSPKGPSKRMAHKLSPGYWTLVVNRVPEPLPTGLTGNLGQALHQMVTTHAGQEMAFQDMVQSGASLSDKPGYRGHRLLRNMGNPHEFALYVYLADDVEPSTIEEILNVIEPYASANSGGMYRIELSSEFPA